MKCGLDKALIKKKEKENPMNGNPALSSGVTR